MVPLGGLARARRTRAGQTSRQPTPGRLALAGSALCRRVPGSRVRGLVPASPAGTGTSRAPARGRVPARPGHAPTPTGRPVPA